MSAPDKDGVLIELAERVERASGADRELDAAIHEAVTTFPPRRAGVGWPDENALVVPAFPGWVLLPTYTASVDAGMCLVPEGYAWAICNFDPDGGPRRDCAAFVAPTPKTESDAVCAATPALALTAACLRARTGK